MINPFAILGVILIIIVITVVIFSHFNPQYVHGLNNTKLTLDCIRMFYSDTWNKGYVEDLAEFCATLK